MEMVDVVDEQLNVLSTVSKQEAHEKGLLHKTVIAEIINSRGEMVLVQQSSQKQDAGQYVSPVGGHVTAGESDEEALQREAMEECGLHDFTYTFKGKAIYNREVIGRKENHYFLVYEIHSDEPLVLNEESISYKAFSKEELKKILHETPEQFGGAFHFVVDTFYPELR